MDDEAQLAKDVEDMYMSFDGTDAETNTDEKEEEEAV